MKRIIIIGEGQTEQAFCNDVLRPHFLAKGIYLQNPVIKKTGGGIVRWSALKLQIEKHLKEDKTAFVTTLIDYYGIHSYHGYPGWEAAKVFHDRVLAMDQIEDGMWQDIDPVLRQRFIPYIQLHEFEGLLFSNIQVLFNSFETDEFSDYNYLTATIKEFDNPELINDGPQTAPSKRLARIVKGCNKVTFGVLLATDIGLTTIMNKCPRFSGWISKLESLS